LIFILNAGYKVSSEFGEDIIIPLKEKPGRHELNGMLAAKGSGIKEGYEIEKASIMDVMPTILHLMGLPIPSDVDGKVLKEIFVEGGEPATREVKFERAKEEDRIKKKIKFLADKGGI
jgi:predicted AlkP superfamily phosphohydrolase/phosphomutase